MSRIYKEKMLDQIRDINLVTGLSMPEEEYRFMYSRDWRFDYAYPDLKIAIEYQGGIFMKNKKGGHQTVRGQTNDWEKFNEAQIRGWFVICLNPKTIDNGTFYGQLRNAILVRLERISYEHGKEELYAINNKSRSRSKYNKNNSVT